MGRARTIALAIFRALLSSPFGDQIGKPFKSTQVGFEPTSPVFAFRHPPGLNDWARQSLPQQVVSQKWNTVRILDGTDFQQVTAIDCKQSLRGEPQSIVVKSDAGIALAGLVANKPLAGVVNIITLIGSWDSSGQLAQKFLRIAEPVRPHFTTDPQATFACSGVGSAMMHYPRTRSTNRRTVAENCSLWQDVTLPGPSHSTILAQSSTTEVYPSAFQYLKSFSDTATWAIPASFKNGDAGTKGVETGGATGKLCGGEAGAFAKSKFAKMPLANRKNQQYKAEKGLAPLVPGSGRARTAADKMTAPTAPEKGWTNQLAVSVVKDVAAISEASIALRGDHPKSGKVLSPEVQKS